MPEDRLRSAVVDAISRLCEVIGDDPGREGLVETPRRIADMWIEMLTIASYRRLP